ncbi:E3 ubiquitin-protein ligase RBBP6-like isoform X2 [Xenia sp. Carnegie-2017]|uniref:E3 ubiquitin-protein ligase RBBP6-like isoform X2 n=1 Tax=Xenia sp. Carnegie-2017 TaxID=2897299 RepID=UPI001F03DA1C|nr:E3 ubiquitin-protein ligase RBBP6-like isoform X2 [Xenia sp. Carnegie-2017]
MSFIHYKFKNNLDYKTLSFDGLSISLCDLKQAILSQNRTKGSETDLEVTNAQTKEVYTDNGTQIPKNASVIVRRTRSGPKEKAMTAAERPQSPGEASKPTESSDDPPVVPLSKLNKVADLASANASEEDKIAAMMNQAGEDWDPSSYAKAKGRHFNPAPRQPPPPHYMCFRCRKPGHWIQNCPKNNDPNYDLKIRRTTGIPKSFLRPAEKPGQKGALLVPETGEHAVPIVDHIAYEQAALKKRPAAISSQAENEKPVPPEYFCPLCKNIMKNAVVVPCCGESFCDNCIEKYLLENDHVCFSCHSEEVFPASIVVNKHLRQSIIKIQSSGFEAGGLGTTMSSPSGHRDEEQGKSTPVTAPNAEASAVSVLDETKKAASGTSTPPTVSQLTVTVAKVTSAPVTMLPPGVVPPTQATMIDPRLQRSEGILQPMAVPLHVATPLHRPTFVVPAPSFHHTSLVHPTVPAIPSPFGHHIAHSAMLPPTRHPFANLNAGMMNEEEFYRAKQKLQERRKRRKDGGDRKSRTKRDRSPRSPRDRRGSPGSRRSPFDRKRSPSWSSSRSSSRSSRSQSWSKSPSRSYSRSKSRTPINWDRSRSPSLERKHGRHEDDRKRRHAHDSRKQSKHDQSHISEKAVVKSKDKSRISNPDTMKNKSQKSSKKTTESSRKEAVKNEPAKEKMETGTKACKKVESFRDDIGRKDMKLKFNDKSKSDSKSTEMIKNVSSNQSKTDHQPVDAKSRNKVDSRSESAKGTKNPNITGSKAKGVVNTTLKNKDTKEKSQRNVEQKKGSREAQSKDGEGRRTKRMSNLPEPSTESSSKSKSPKHDSKICKKTEKMGGSFRVINVIKVNSKCAVSDRNKNSVSKSDKASSRSGSKKDFLETSRDLQKSSTKDSTKNRETELSGSSSQNEKPRKKTVYKTKKKNVEMSTGKSEKFIDNLQRQTTSPKTERKRKSNREGSALSFKKDRTIKSEGKGGEKPIVPKTTKQYKNEGPTLIKTITSKKSTNSSELDNSNKSSVSIVRKCSISDLRDIVIKNSDRLDSAGSDEKSIKKRKVSRKRSKDNEDNSDDSSDKPRKKKKKRLSVYEEDHKDLKRKKRKHKRKHRKHKHKKKSKRKTRRPETSEESEDDSDRECDYSDSDKNEDDSFKVHKGNSAIEFGVGQHWSRKFEHIAEKKSFESDRSTHRCKNLTKADSYDDEDNDDWSAIDSLKVEVNTGSCDVSDDDIYLEDVVEQGTSDEEKLQHDEDDEDEELDYDEDTVKDYESEEELKVDLEGKIEADEKEEDYVVEEEKSDMEFESDEGVSEEGDDDCDTVSDKVDSDLGKDDEEEDIEEVNDQKDEEEDEEMDEGEEDNEVEKEDDVEEEDKGEEENEGEEKDEGQLENVGSALEDNDDEDDEVDGDDDGEDGQDDSEEVDDTIEENNSDKENKVQMEVEEPDDKDEVVEEKIDLDNVVIDKDDKENDLEQDVTQEDNQDEVEEKENRVKRDANIEENEEMSGQESEKEHENSENKDVEHEQNEEQHEHHEEKQELEEEQIHKVEVVEIEVEHDNPAQQQFTEISDEPEQNKVTKVGVNDELEIKMSVNENEQVDPTTEFELEKHKETERENICDEENEGESVTTSVNSREIAGNFNNNTHDEIVSMATDDNSCGGYVFRHNVDGDNETEDLFDEALLGTNEDDWNYNQNCNVDELYGDVDVSFQASNYVHCDVWSGDNRDVVLAVDKVAISNDRNKLDFKERECTTNNVNNGWSGKSCHSYPCLDSGVSSAKNTRSEESRDSNYSAF